MPNTVERVKGLRLKPIQESVTQDFLKEFERKVYDLDRT